VNWFGKRKLKVFGNLAVEKKKIRGISLNNTRCQNNKGGYYYVHRF